MRWNNVSTGNLPAKTPHAWWIDFPLARQAGFRQNQTKFCSE